MARARGGSAPGRGAARTVGGGGFGGDPVKTVLRFRTRRITVLRGTTVNAFGDPDDTGQPYLTGVPAAIAETQDTVFDAATQRQQTVRSVTCVVPGWTDVIDTDTVFDPATGYYYLIESIQARPGIGYFPAEKVLSLKMRSGVSLASDLYRARVPASASPVVCGADVLPLARGPVPPPPGPQPVKPLLPQGRSVKDRTGTRRVDAHRRSVARWADGTGHHGTGLGTERARRLGPPR